MTTETIPAGLLKTQEGRVYLNDEHAWGRYVTWFHKKYKKGKHTDIPERFPCLIETRVMKYRMSEEVFYEHAIFYREDIEAEMEKCKVWLQRFYDPTTLVNRSTGT